MNGKAGAVDDPLLESWLRRYPRIAPLADTYVAYSTPDAATWPSVVEPSPMDDCVRCSVHAAAIMRRCLAIARWPAAGGTWAGESSGASPRRTDTLAALEAEAWGAFLAAFLTVESSDRLGRGETDGQARALLHMAAPVVALANARQAVAITAAAIEASGEAVLSGEATLEGLLREALGLARRAGGLRALELDTLLPSELHAGLAALMGRASACLRGLTEPRLVAASRVAVGALERATLWLESGKDHEVLQAGAARLAVTFARGLELALLCEHAQWMMDHGGDRRGFAAALRFSRLPVDQVHEVDLELDRALLAPTGGRG
ncbi:MAG: hypothetical protein WBO04_14325 [Steroidobacteraceae bacterium]